MGETGTSYDAWNDIEQEERMREDDKCLDKVALCRTNDRSSDKETGRELLITATHHGPLL